MANQATANKLNRDLASEGEQIALCSQAGSGKYEIHVKGQLNSHWSEWFDGLQLRLLDNGEMILCGPVIDQAALMGILNKLYRLNLPLISVNEVVNGISNDKPNQKEL